MAVWDKQKAVRLINRDVYRAISEEGWNRLTDKVERMVFLPDTFLTTSGADKREASRDEWMGKIQWDKLGESAYSRVIRDHSWTFTRWSEMIDRVRAFDPELVPLADVDSENFHIFSSLFMGGKLFDYLGDRSDQVSIILCAFFEIADLIALKSNRILLRLAFHREFSDVDLTKRFNVLNDVMLEVLREQSVRVRENRATHYRMKLKKQLLVPEFAERRRLRGLDLPDLSDEARDIISDFVTKYSSLKELFDEPDHLLTVPDRVLREFTGEGPFPALISPVINAYEYLKGLVEGLAFISEMNNENLPESHIEVTKILPLLEKKTKHAIRVYLRIYDHPGDDFTPLQVAVLDRKTLSIELINLVGDGKTYLEMEFMHIDAFLR